MPLTEVHERAILGTSKYGMALSLTTIGGYKSHLSPTAGPLHLFQVIFKSLDWLHVSVMGDGFNWSTVTRNVKNTLCST